MVYANDPAAKLFGLPSREALIEVANRTLASGDESQLAFTDEQGRPFPIENLPSRKARSGLEVPPVVLSFRLAASRAGAGSSPERNRSSTETGMCRSSSG